VAETALNPPGTDELAEFMAVSESSLDPRSESMLQQATDLMAMATALEVYPATRCGRMMRNGILDMAWALLVGLANRTEQYSPFNSERIGSYSYSKAVAAVLAGEATGVPMFDMAVACVANAAGGPVSISSEKVFNPTGLTEAELELAERVWTYGNL